MASENLKNSYYILHLLFYSDIIVQPWTKNWIVSICYLVPKLLIKLNECRVLVNELRDWKVQIKRKLKLTKLCENKRVSTWKAWKCLEGVTETKGTCRMKSFYNVNIFNSVTVLIYYCSKIEILNSN